MKSTSLSLLFAGLFATAAQAVVTPVSYTFNSSANDVDGHWTNAEDWSTSESGGYFYISNQFSADGSNYVRFSDAGAGVGATASIANVFGVLDDSTPTALSFSYYTGNYWGTSVGLGATASQGLTITADRYDSSVSISLNGTQLASQSFDFTSSAWIDFRLDINPGANGGTGSATVYSRPTDGSQEWTAVTGLLNIGLGLDATRTAGDSTNPANWNTLWFHHEGADSGLDNLSVAAVPEPSSLALLGAGSLLLGTLRRRSPRA